MKTTDRFNHCQTYESIIINESESEVLIEFFPLYLNRFSFNFIVKELNTKLNKRFDNKYISFENHSAIISKKFS